MLRTLFGLVLALFALSCTSPVNAWDAFNNQRSPSRFSLQGPDDLKLTLKGQVQTTLGDLEGKGGLLHDSRTDTTTIGTRSPHVRLNQITLALRLESEDGLAFYTETLFTSRNARAQAAWLDGRWHHGPWSFHTEAGLHLPFVATDPYTARAPLTSRIYWGTSEFHVTTTGTWTSPRLTLQAGVSLAVMRPLQSTPVNDASTRNTTLSVLSYGQAAPFSGNQSVQGARGSISTGPATLEGFLFLGALSAESGTDELRNRIAHFSYLPGYNTENARAQNDTFWWAGGRFDLQQSGFEARLEHISSQESLLRRDVSYIQAGYTHQNHTRYLRTLEIRGRYEQYRIHHADDALTETRSLRTPEPSQALTWDWTLWTLSAATWLYRDLLRTTLEYTWIQENNGSSALARPNDPFRNNELTLQLELRL